MKNLFFITLIAGTFAILPFSMNAGNNVDPNVESHNLYQVNDIKEILEFDIKVYDCTVTYTNSQGVTFTATESDCIKAFEKVSPFIEAQ